MKPSSFASSGCATSNFAVTADCSAVPMSFRLMSMPVLAATARPSARQRCACQCGEQIEVCQRMLGTRVKQSHGVKARRSHCIKTAQDVLTPNMEARTIRSTALQCVIHEGFQMRQYNSMHTTLVPLPLCSATCCASCSIRKMSRRRSRASICWSRVHLVVNQSTNTISDVHGSKHYYRRWCRHC